MAYIYQVSFDLSPAQLKQIQMGSCLEHVLSYLKAVLPNQPGFVNARAMYSLNVPKKTEVVFSSIWDRWEDLHQHMESKLAEDKIQKEFEPCLDLGDLEVRYYEELP